MVVLILVAAALTLVILGGCAALVGKLYVPVGPDQALVVVDGQQRVRVSRKGLLVIPVVHRAELVDLRTTTLEVDNGSRGFRCADRIRVTMKARFLVAVSPTDDDIQLASRRVGASRVTDADSLLHLLGPRFETAIAAAVGELRYAEIVDNRRSLEDTVSTIAGVELDGFVLQEVHLGEILQVPIEVLDPSDILDAEAIRNITSATAEANRATQELRRELSLAKIEQDVAAGEQIMRLEALQTEREREHADHIEALKKV